MASFSSRTFTVGIPNVSDSAFRAARRVIINTEVLKAAKVYAGDVLALSAPGSSNKLFAVGIAWPSHETPQDSIFVSSSLLLTAGLSEGSKVQITPLTSAKPPLRDSRKARVVRLRKIEEVESTAVKNSDSSAIKSSDTAKGKRREWLTLLVREALVDIRYITSTQKFEVVYEGKTRRFAVASVEDQSTVLREKDIADDLRHLSLDSAPQVWTVDWETQAIIEDDESPTESMSSPNKSDTEVLDSNAEPTSYATVGGLDKQIAQIRDLIEIPLTRPDLFRHFGLKPPRGILLHGPPGTGKTHLARAIASSTHSSVVVVNGPELSSAYHGETESKLRDVFSEAYKRSPCIVVLDEVDALCPRREDGPGGEVEKRVVAQLLTIMDGMEAQGDAKTSGAEPRVVVVATTNRPNAIDPALRRPGRFDREIEIGIPDAEARYSILKVLLTKTPHSISQADLRAVAARAHGYVGADLSAVVREAGTLAIKRWLASRLKDTSIDMEPPSAPELTLADLQISLPTVRPSALRSLFLDTVPVRYSEIGGQSHTIQKLRECIEWPLLHPESFARLGVRPPRGVLLYGPPGCSKTLLVRASATESGVNFLAVKGPELLNKYVGESEKAVREIFSKARAAAPSIIFFDEIDALATSRSSSEGGGSAHEGVLTSLLNEMDGVEELTGVTIVAATNRPDVIDSALMRPGRLDRILYVGPPDHAGRMEILRIRTAKMAVEPGLDLDSLATITEGCSGAEMVSLCQEAAILTMKKDIQSPYVPHEAFFSAAKAIRKQITPEVVEGFARWRAENGVVDA